MELGDVEQNLDSVTILIDEKLQKLSPIIPERSIYRVTKHLREMNCMAYEPRVISIGPFHHDQQKFKVTEELKHRFFNSYRRRVNLSTQVIVEKVRSWEENAHKYYAETINMNNEEFLEMMVLDGCFIVEFLIEERTYLFHANENKVHYSFYKAMHSDIQTDLIMLENQLPFFVLRGLFDLVSPTHLDRCPRDFESIVDRFLNSGVLPSGILTYTKLNQSPRHLLDFLSCYFNPLDETDVDHEGRYLPPSATQLHEAGVVFKKLEEKETCLVNLSFKDGILKIPPLIIDDDFETLARNILAFTQHGFQEHAIGYFEFLDKLITTEKDVRLLVKKGIISNNIGGSDIEISKLFNDLCKYITVPRIKRFSNVSKDLNRYCERRRNNGWLH